MEIKSFAGQGHKATIPSNIQEFIDRRPEFKPLVTKAKRWLSKSLGRSFCGGTAIGKNYDTLILDVTFQSSDVYINCDKETIEVLGTEVTNQQEFVAALKEKYTIK